MGRPVFKFALPDGSLEYVGRVDVACNVSPIGSRGNVLTHGNFLSMQAVSNRMRGANCHGRQCFDLPSSWQSVQSFVQ